MRLEATSEHRNETNDAGDDVTMVTERDQIRDVSVRWDRQYPPSRADEPYMDDKIEIGNKLRALNRETCSAQDVAAIIGNDSWIGTRCGECGERTLDYMVVGQEPAYLCLGCCVKIG